MYVRKQGRSFADRFWSRAEPEPNSGCFLWMGVWSVYGYGVIRSGQGKKLRRAHRIAWELSFGSIPTGLCVLHKCDNRVCVNPAHLFLGTKADNCRDMWGKKRGVSLCGEGRTNSRLTEDVVAAIRREYIPRSVTYTMLGTKYGVDRMTVYDVIKRRTWNHV